MALARRRVGRTVSLRYSTRVPTNSIVACEEWSGVPEAESNPDKPALRTPAEVKI